MNASATPSWDREDFRENYSFKEKCKMPVCPQCDNMLDFEEDEVDEGDVVSCDECGTELEVVGTDPLELAKIEEEEEDDEEYEDEEEE